MESKINSIQSDTSNKDVNNNNIKENIEYRRKQAEKTFLKNLDENYVDGCTLGHYIVYNNSMTIVQVKIIASDGHFANRKELEEYLEDSNRYAIKEFHFLGKSEAWYKLPFSQKITLLNPDFSNDQRIF